MKTYTIYHLENRKVHRDLVTTSSATAVDFVYRKKRQNPQLEYWYESEIVREIAGGVSG